MTQNLEQPLVTVEHLGLNRNHKQILKDISFKISQGEIISLIGPNGAGKSSLVKCIVGIWPICEGKLKQQPGLRIGYMPQSIQWDASLPMTVSRFLKLGQPHVDIHKILDEVGVTYAKDSQLSTLSGGERQRVLLARALLRKPHLLVLDEPAQGVDLVGQDELYQLISQIRDQYQCGVLLVSHDLNLVMAKTDYVLCINQHICCYGSPQMVGQDPSFLKLFGKAPEVALYAHHHDHQHDVSGDVISNEGSSDDE